MLSKALCILALSLVNPLCGGQTEDKKELNIAYTPKDFSYLKGMSGFSNSLLDLHFSLYQGYVKNCNLLLEKLQALEDAEQMRSVEWGALKRRLGWEFDGMRLHELYFENLGGKGDRKGGSEIVAALEKQFGSFEAWKQAFISTGMIRGIGWVILYKDPLSQKLINCWINEHDVGHLATSAPLIVMDVWEHAYLTEYGLNREKYLQVFFENIDWKVVNRRFSTLKSSTIQD
jgi:Fe-Mn family superoxide dismutase